MSFSADILASTLQDLLPGYVDLYTLNHPLWSRVKSGGGFNRRKLKGPWVEFNVLTGGPGQAVTDRTGSTVLAGTRAQKLVRGIEYGARIIYYFAVPEKDLDEASTPYDFANLVENYGEAGMADVMERMANQLARGASTSGTDPLGGGVDGFITLNGESTYNPQSGGRTGVFEYAARASQGDTVHDIPKEGAASGTFGWYNQYGDINSFGMDGRKVLRTVRDAANQQGASLDGGIDLLLGDDASYQNYAENLDDQVVAAVVENDKGQGRIREGLKFGTATFFSEPAIDLTDTASFTTATSRSGLIYGLCSKDWEMFTVGDKNAGSDLFTVSDPIPVPDQPLIHYRVTFYANMLCKNLRRQFAVTGGATA